MDRTDRPKTGKVQWVLGPLAVRASVQDVQVPNCFGGFGRLGWGYIPDGFITDLGQSSIPGTGTCPQHVYRVM